MKYVVFLIVLLCANFSFGQNFEGKYIDIEGDSLFYKIGGNLKSNETIVFLHGGLYGSVDDFDDYAEVLADDYRLISVSTRGYYSSDMGSQPFSYGLFANDVKLILNQEKIDKTIVIGFSDGAITAYRFAASYPEKTVKVVVLAGVLNKGHYLDTEWIENINRKRALQENRRKTELLLSRMKEPQLYDELIEKLKVLWNADTYISDEDAKEITMPVLIVGGDRDDFFGVNSFVEIYNLLPNAQLLINPNTTHRIKSIELLNNHIIPYLKSDL